MPPDSKYFTLERPAVAELTVKGSRFIARVFPSPERATAEAQIARVVEDFADATHNCFAYRIGIGDRSETRSSDAGEPSGTAGRPILQAIEARDLTNVTVVVTRYFGGTKLGTGGLIRAYSGAAFAALDQAGVVRIYEKSHLYLRFDFSLANIVHTLVERFEGKILDSHYEDESVYKIEINQSREQAFAAELRDNTRGKVKISIEEQ